MLPLVKNTESQKYVQQAYTTTNGVKTSPKYTHIQTDKIYQVIENMGYLPVKSSSSRRFNEHSRHITQFEHPSILVEGLKPRLIVDNAHDGSRSFTLRFGVYRVYCANGLVMGSDIIKPLRIRHVGQPVDIERRIYDFVAQATEKVLSMYQSMATKILTRDEIISLVSQAHQLRYGEKDTNFETTLKWVNYSRRPEDYGDSLWAIYNRLQEALMHGTKNRSKRIQSDRRAIDFNDALSNLAMQFAA
jgi:hypothetical protein